ncbi:oligosaccharide flippase family protein [Bradyrhizobium erythrophlei]|uniref:oligosaccharide flippase family protein n=1 Tax=Bradyrhizobium erythrophlei TaxID=1437360 RepID=UPI0035E4C1F7
MLDPTAASSKRREATKSIAASSPMFATRRIAAGLRAVHGRWQQIVNVGLLIAGFGLGQGTIFAVQTVLVAAGEYDLLAAFGTHYSFAVLGIILVDAGASTTLARVVARLSGERTPCDEVWQTFCETTAIRLLIAALVCVATATYALGFVSGGFTRWYVALAVPGLLLWAVNPVGLLDGLRLSGVSGITGSAAYVITAIGLALATHRSAEAAGAILGGAFSIGYFVTVAAQWIALVRKGWLPQFRKMTRAGLMKAFRDGAALLFLSVPGQINMRVQLLLSTVYLGAETTALVVYAKQIATAANQIIVFILRVEFPSLVERLAEPGKHSLGSLLGAQKMALHSAVILAVGITGASVIAAAVPAFGLHRGAAIIAAFAPTIVMLSLSSMMTQSMAALGAYGVIAKALAISSVTAMLVGYALVSTLGVYALVVGEVSFHIVACYVVYRYLRRLG